MKDKTPELFRSANPTMFYRVMRFIWLHTGIIIILVPFSVYLLTACPTVYLGDSGELTAAAFSLGIPHNSGYPIYALLGKLFCFLPIGSIGFRMNLMSSLFAVLTVWLVYSLTLRITASKLSAFAGALFLAFVPVLWSQTVSAEVYTLHAFFVALLMRVLWWWDETREFSRLSLFVFLTGISFGNHMQTVMLAPAVLFIVISADYRILSNVRNFFFLSAVFLLALSVYLYLPVRTEAEAAIRWGDPNTLDRFIAHVTASAHRKSYVLTKSPLEYALRAKETLLLVISQFGALLLLALWGWLKMARMRWQIFFLAVIMFDFVYTIFLNIISFQITAFSIPTCIVSAILIGIGIAHILEWTRHYLFFGKTSHRVLTGAFCVLPAIPLASNFDLCNQSRNYAAYEHIQNIFSTVDDQSTLFLDGDNNIFPVTYGRIVERMREDVTLYDRLNLLFRMPYQNDRQACSGMKGGEFRRCVERWIVENTQNGVYYAVFNPHAVSVPDQFVVYPYGVLYKADPGKIRFPEDIGKRVWNRYMTESIFDNFYKDFMNRHLCAQFHFSLSKYLFMVGQPSLGLKASKWASQMAYDDTMIHSDIALLLTDHGFLEDARLELEKALIYYDDLSGVYTNWGHYYYGLRDYDEAVLFFRKAVELNPKSFDYYNNLGLALYQAGRREEAIIAFQQSLSIHGNQPKVERFLQEHGLT